MRLVSGLGKLTAALPDSKVWTLCLSSSLPLGPRFLVSHTRGQCLHWDSKLHSSCWVPLEISPGGQNRSYSCLLQCDKEGHLQPGERAGGECLRGLLPSLINSFFHWSKIAQHFIIGNRNLLLSLTLRTAFWAVRMRREVRIVHAAI